MAIIVRPDGSTAQVFVPNGANVVEHEGRMYRRRRSFPIDLWDDEGPHTTRPKKPYLRHELFDADPNCDHDIEELWDGVKCRKCRGWFCF